MSYYGSNYVQQGNAQVGDVPPYAPYGIGACGQEPVDKNYFVAMNSGAFSGTCGLCAKVTYGGNCVVAPIVDRCPGCGSGIDVSLYAFSQLVGSEARAIEMGIASVNFEVVVCPANRASTGSQSISNTDPCSGSSSGDAAVSVSTQSTRSTSSTSNTGSRSTSSTSNTGSSTTSSTSTTSSITSTATGSTSTSTRSAGSTVTVTITISKSTPTTTTSTITIVV